MPKILTLALILATATHAVNTFAILEVVPKAEIEDISVTETRHITDELRKQAVQTLPKEGYAVLTRDNMFALLPPDEKEAECLAESCAVDIGRAIGAEYISQGSIGRFGNELSLSIELYETMSGKLIGSIVMESPDVKGLLLAIREQAPALFERMKPEESIKPKIDPQIDQKPHIKTSTWIAISLDVLGAAALGFGVYQHFQKNKLYDDYKKLPKDHLKENSTLKKANDAQDLRDIGFITGGVLLGAGIAVHVWF